ncbi:MAG: stage II sporulation protein E [Syntrophomonadaceae bacterium]|nr:stage II sporulation protein E [Syntrophomonadaceae bacterium]MDD3023142.1 stage II sporulation protein E [Syntrophomonadaceae bacterium]
MLEKFEIYPYQRIAETLLKKPRRKRKIGFKYWNKLPKHFSLTSKMITVLKTIPSIENLLLCIAMLLMSRAFVLSDLLPFGYAFFTAFGYRDRNRSLLLLIFSIIGFSTVLSGLGLGSNILTLLILMGVINYITIPLDKNCWILPLLTASVIFVVKSLAVLFTGMSFYQEMVVTFEAMIAGVLTFVLLVVSDAVKQRKTLDSFKFEDIVAFMVLGIGIIMGIGQVNLAGLSLSGIVCRLGILVAAFLWGSPGGTMVGVMTGIIPSVSSSVFTQTLGIYAFSGLLAGLFRNFGRLGVIIGFMLGNLALSMFLSQTQATILGIWETGIACLIFSILPASLKEKMPLESLGPINNDSEIPVFDTRIKENARNQIQNLATVFDELSSTFAGEVEMKRRSKPVACLNYLYEQVSRNFCNDCSRYNTCWGKECYDTSQHMLDLFTMVEAGGELDYEKCPRDFKRRCIQSRDMVKTINYLFDRLRINEYWSEKLDESRDLVATQLKGVSQVIKGLAKEIDINTEVDLALRVLLLQENKRLGLNLRDITPLKSARGELCLNVIMDACSDGTHCQTTIAPAISGVLGYKVEISRKNCPRLKGRGQCEFSLLRAFNYKVSTGTAQVGKETVCGDSYTISNLNEGKLLIALSDGMGVGEKACNESQATVRLLENLLNSGFDREIALNTINSVLLLRSGSEIFSTLDMIVFDCYTGEVDFIKVGSAPSFIKRGKKVGMVISNSLPIGIMDNVDMVSETRMLVPRDILVMLSDGVLDVSRQKAGEQWIPDLLSSYNGKEPQELAELIINRALGMTKGQPADDMTVICIYIDLA